MSRGTAILIVFMFLGWCLFMYAYFEVPAFKAAFEQFLVEELT